MKIKWVYWIIAILYTISIAFYMDHTPYYLKDGNFYTSIWWLLGVSGAMCAFLFYGWTFEGTKLYKHFNKKIRITLK